MMVKNRNIRGVSDENWDWLKKVAAFRGIQIGALLDKIIEEWAWEGVPATEAALVYENDVRKSRRGSRSTPANTDRARRD